MKVEAIHHVPMRPEFKSPFSAAYAIEGGRLIFFSGCCTIPTYHKHPHDPEEEQQWLAADFRAQTERTFAHIKEIMDAAGARMADILKLTIFTTDMGNQTSSTRSPPATSTRTGRRRVPWWAYRRWRIREC
jgi:enamine deaminase RidA (YjgF/YER057c/UK114 family)